MKKLILSLFISLLLIIGAICGCNVTNVSTNNGKPYDETWQSATDAVASMQLGWNLGNTFDATNYRSDSYDTEVSWGNPRTTKTMFQSVKNMGFGAVRIPITWRNHIDEQGNVEGWWMDRVEEVVNYALDLDLYTIINVHHDTGEQGWMKASGVDVESMTNRFTKLWQQIATRFLSYGEKLLFEGFNELLDAENNWVFPSNQSLEVVNHLNQAFVDTVRATGGNNAHRNLIVNTYAGSSASGPLQQFKLPKDTYSNHLVVEMHCYIPWEFCSDREAMWTQEIENGMVGSFDYIRQTMGWDIPIIIGEFGCVRRKDTQSQNAYVSATIKAMKKNNLVGFYWDDGGSFRLLDRRTLDWESTKPGFLLAMMQALHNDK